MSRRITSAPDLLTLLLKGLTRNYDSLLDLLSFHTYILLYTRCFKLENTLKQTNKNSPRNWHIYFHICISLPQTR